jgi:Holliday junction DNA helicase RuvA
MIESLRGIVDFCSADSAVLRLGGVSVRLGITAETAHSLRPGAQAELFTHLYMREDVLAVYGFSSIDERSLFEELLGVTGVGPRVALGFLSAFTPSGLREAIDNEDVARLTRVPGVGRKTAQRVVLELKGKLVVVVASIAPPSQFTPRDQELIQVLAGLGYTSSEAGEAVRHSKEVAAEGTDEDRLRAALSYFAAR